MAEPKSVLFVCLGNICRSPMAEIVMNYLIKENGISWKVDSAGTGAYHVGDGPDSRSVSTCAKFLKDKMPKVTHKARQLRKEDFTRFDFILCMDEENLRNINAVRPATSTTHVALLGSFDPEGESIIEDPYYGGNDGFEYNFNQVVRCCTELIKKHS